ncbi:MAG: nucleotidyltransferase family protein [Deltaproteobacteria bacterium]|nr:nucleotidyltransferase family protein [Deltaproteobacteria bacterium]
MTLRDQVLARRDAVLRAAARCGARNVRLFGSAARDEAGPDSDLDFLVDLEPNRSLLDVAGLAVELERLFGRPVDVVTERGLRERLRDRILREAVPL